jgi:deazaflavin-dependent oxidoreductase (nitroreductase family)
MSNVQRRGFLIFNKLFMIPMFQLGLGQFVGNKLSGYIMVIKTIGRKTGKVRHSPVSYAIHKGNVYCIAGWGRTTDWYRNMIVSREVELLLPGGTIFGKVEEVDDQEERRIVIRKILQNAGFAGFLEGFNPYRVTDEVMLKKTADMPLVCIHPAGVGNGPGDPTGYSWVWNVVSGILIILIIIALTR